VAEEVAEEVAEAELVVLEDSAAMVGLVETEAQVVATEAQVVAEEVVAEVAVVEEVEAV
jgi:hypothetical protein